MHFRWISCVVVTAIGFLGVDARPGSPEETKNVDDPQKVADKVVLATLAPHQVVERALGFLEKDAAKWRTEHGCATCHHGTMTDWALSEAKNNGYTVDAKSLGITVQWTKDQFIPKFSKPRDQRPGWNLVSLAGIYLGVMSQTLPILSRDEINALAVHLARHQEEDGVWLIPPPNNGAPPTWESRETTALLALLAWEPYVPADPQQATTASVSHEKAVDWLRTNKSTETTQVITLRLLLDVRMSKPADQLQPGIDQILGRQNCDGGWEPNSGHSERRLYYWANLMGAQFRRH